MELTKDQQSALERWHLLGTTTPTNPILQFAFELYFEPMGIRADALSYDALAALENPGAQLTLIEPRLDPKKVDRAWSQFPTIEPLLGVLDYIAPVFASNGAIKEFAILKEFTLTDENNSMMSTFVESAEQAKAKEFEKTYATPIFELSDSLTAAAKLYIDAALDLMIQPSVISSEFAQQFITNPRQYATHVFGLFTQAPPKV